MIALTPLNKKQTNNHHHTHITHIFKIALFSHYLFLEVPALQISLQGFLLYFDDVIGVMAEMREARMSENPGVRLKWCISTTQLVVTYVPHRLISINKSALLPFPGCTAHSACGTAKILLLLSASCL